MHKDVLREGENRVRLTVLGSTGGRLVFTSTLDVNKGTSVATLPTPAPGTSTMQHYNNSKVKRQP